MTVQTRVALGNRIRQLREERNLTQKKLALMINIERGYLSKVEQGVRNLGFDNLEKIADGLGISLSELVHGIGPNLSPGQTEKNHANQDPRKGAQVTHFSTKLRK